MGRGRAVVAGGDSPIGIALAKRLKRIGYDVIRTSRRTPGNLDAPASRYLDFLTLDGLDALPEADWTFIVAAETRFGECARAPERSARINADAPVAIGKRQASRGGRVFLFSSIAVHDGREMDPSEASDPKPETVYGRQKREAELGLLDAGIDPIILRPAKVVIPRFALFDQWRAAFREGRWSRHSRTWSWRRSGWIPSLTFARGLRRCLRRAACIKRAREIN